VHTIKAYHTNLLSHSLLYVKSAFYDSKVACLQINVEVHYLITVSLLLNLEKYLAAVYAAVLND
jgi:hypothetical protein